MSAQDTSPDTPTGNSVNAALLAIRVYQRWISPYKGFRCAHSVLHGGPGCSGYAAEAIRDRGLLGAIRPIRQRFRDCRAAFVTLMAEKSDDSDNEPKGGKSGIRGILGNVCPGLCVGCDLGAAPGGVACGGASAGAEAAGGVCSAVSCCS